MVREVRLNKCICKLVLLCEKVDTSLTDERWSMLGRADATIFAKLVESSLVIAYTHGEEKPGTCCVGIPTASSIQ